MAGSYVESKLSSSTYFNSNSAIKFLNPPGLDNWPEDIVPPLPINVDYLAILNLVNALVHIYGDDSYFIKESDGSIRGLHLIMSKYLLPLLCNVHVIKTDPVLTSGNGSLVAPDNFVGSF